MHSYVGFDGYERQAHMPLDSMGRQSELSGDVLLLQAFAPAEEVDLPLLWGQLADRLFQQGKTGFPGGLFGRLCLLDHLRDPGLLLNIVPCQLAETIEGVITAEDEEPGMEVFHFRELFLFHPDFHKSVLDDLFGHALGTSEPEDIFRQLLMPAMKECAKSTGIARGDTQEQLFLIVL